MKTLTKELQDKISPETALDLLIEGNKRFTKNVSANRNLLEQANKTKSGQYPFAVILSCIDSRAPVELIFDQGIGDVFSVRIAGNIINQDILGSIEFSCKLAGAKLIVILGHTHCGAIKGACDNVEMGNLTGLINKIKPAINSESSIQNNRDASNPDFISKVSEINVKKSIEELLNKSSIIQNMVSDSTCKVVGGMHDISTGVVTFLND